MSKISQYIILENAAIIFAEGGYHTFSIRSLAKKINISPSVIYHYFKSEDELLKAMFDYINTQLGQKRKALIPTKTAEQMMKQRIEFQLDNAEMIVAVLKYYLNYRNNFSKFKNGFVPDKSSLHIEEVLKFGMETKEFRVDNLEDEAKVITHAINGFLLEYFPYKPQGSEKIQLINRINKFLMKALRGGEIK